MTDKYELEFWTKVKIIRDLDLKVEQIVKEDKKKQEDTRKVINMILICINTRELLDGGLVLYKKNALLRCAMNIFFKYILKTFKKYNNN